jgi:hypothetical protein
MKLKINVNGEVREDEYEVIDSKTVLAGFKPMMGTRKNKEIMRKFKKNDGIIFRIDPKATLAVLKQSGKKREFVYPQECVFVAVDELEKEPIVVPIVKNSRTGEIDRRNSARHLKNAIKLHGKNNVTTEHKMTEEEKEVIDEAPIPEEELEDLLFSED